MERRPYIRSELARTETLPSGPKPVLLRKHSTKQPVTKIFRLEPGRVLLVANKRDRQRDALAQTWVAAGGRVQRLGRFWEKDPTLAEKALCVYGNVIFCHVLAKIYQLELLGPCDDMLTRMPAELLGRKVHIRDLGALGELDFPCFVKSQVPKLMTSGVVATEKRLREITRGLSEDTRLLVSEVVTFQAEARAFIFDRQVLDCVLYDGQGEESGALEVAQKVAQLEGTPHGFVVDLGRLQGRWVVVEFHPSWGAGLNGCDPDKVLLAIAAATKV